MIIVVSVRKTRSGRYFAYLGGRKMREMDDESAALEWMAGELMQARRVVSHHSSLDIHDVMRHLGLTRNKAE